MQFRNDSVTYIKIYTLGSSGKYITDVTNKILRQTNIKKYSYAPWFSSFNPSDRNS